MQDRTDTLSIEAGEVADKPMRIAFLSNVTLPLHSRCINNGLARNEKDEEGVEAFFRKHVAKETEWNQTSTKFVTSVNPFSGTPLYGRIFCYTTRTRKIG